MSRTAGTEFVFFLNFYHGIVLKLCCSILTFQYRKLERIFWWEKKRTQLMFRPSVSNILLLVPRVSRADKRQTGRSERQDKFLMQSLRRVLCYKPQPNTRSERRYWCTLQDAFEKEKKKGGREAILLVLLIVASERREELRNWWGRGRTEASQKWCAQTNTHRRLDIVEIWLFLH